MKFRQFREWFSFYFGRSHGRGFGLYIIETAPEGISATILFYHWYFGASIVWGEWE